MVILNLKKKVPSAVKRNSLRILVEDTIPLPHMGTLADICFNFLSDNKESIAVKVFSMSILLNIAQYYPEIGNELRQILEGNIHEKSPGYVSRASKIIKELNKKT